MISDDFLPFQVFVDTQVYRSLEFEWGHPLIKSLRQRIERGSIQLVTTNNCLKEIRAQLREMILQFDQGVQKAARLASFLSPLHDPRVTSLLQLSKDRIQADTPGRLHSSSWKRSPALGSPLLMMLLIKCLKLYFSGSPPFGVKNKKNEFPDAANTITLLHHAQLTQSPVYVVSGDGDWERACKANPSLIYIRHLSEMIDKAIRAEWLSTDLWSDEELLEFISAKKTEWLPMMETALRSASQVNLGDGEINSLTILDVTLEFAGHNNHFRKRRDVVV